MFPYEMKIQKDITGCDLCLCFMFGMRIRTALNLLNDEMRNRIVVAASSHLGDDFQIEHLSQLTLLSTTKCATAA